MTAKEIVRKVYPNSEVVIRKNRNHRIEGYTICKDIKEFNNDIQDWELESGNNEELAWENSAKLINEKNKIMTDELKLQFKKIVKFSKPWDDHFDFMESAYNLAAKNLYTREEVENIVINTISETKSQAFENKGELGETFIDFFNIDINSLIPKKCQ